MEGKALELVLLLNVLILPVYSTLPSPSEHAIRIGGNFTLPCNMSTDALLIWLRFRRNETNRQLIAFKSETDAVQIRLYKDQLSLQPSGLLMLHNVSLKNKGHYRCEMDLNEDQTFEHEVQLYVGVPPEIEPFVKSNISLSEGRQLKITCKVSGKPLPNVFWYFINESIHRLSKTEVVRKNTLLIRQARPSNSGLYQCYAHNRLGNAERTLRIKVHEKPRVREFLQTGALDNRIYECNDIKFICGALESKPPVIMFHLYHNGTLVNSSKTGSFTIRQVRLMDQGQYSCVPDNEVEMGWNSSIEIKVLAAPDNCQKKLSSTKKITTKVTATTFTKGHAATPSTPNAENASSNTGNQLYHGYIITAAVLPAFYALRIF